MKKWLTEIGAKVDAWWEKKVYQRKLNEKMERESAERHRVSAMREARIAREEAAPIGPRLGPWPSKLLELYKEKGADHEGALVEILKEEMQHLLEEEIALKHEVDPLGQVPEHTTYGAMYTVTPQRWISKGYLHRNGEGPRVVLTLHGLLGTEPEWVVAMFLGAVEDGRNIGPKGSKWRWCRWLIGEKIYVGWVHPDGMKCIEALQ